MVPGMQYNGQSSLREHPYLLGRMAKPDARDAAYPMKAILPEATARTKRFWSPGKILDQGDWHCPLCSTTHAPCCEQGFCVEAGWLAYLECAPIKTRVLPPRLSIYHRALELDEWPGGAESYAGTSVRAGAKAVRELGYIDIFRWYANFEEFRVGLFEHGPSVVGSVWTRRMFVPDKNGFVIPDGPVAGGHCYCVIGGDDDIPCYDNTLGALLCQQSWGYSFGGIRRRPGRFWLAYSDARSILFGDSNGEACATEQIR